MFIFYIHFILFTIPCYATTKESQVPYVYPYSLKTVVNETQPMPAYGTQMNLRDKLYLPEFGKTVFLEQIPLIQKKNTQEEMMKLLDTFTLKRRKTHVVLPTRNIMINPQYSPIIPIINNISLQVKPMLPVLMPDVPVIPIMQHYLTFDQYLPAHSQIYEQPTKNFSIDQHYKNLNKFKLLEHGEENEKAQKSNYDERNKDQSIDNSEILHKILNNFMKSSNGQKQASVEKLNEPIKPLLVNNHLQKGHKSSQSSTTTVAQFRDQLDHSHKNINYPDIMRNLLSFDFKHLTPSKVTILKPVTLDGAPLDLSKFSDTNKRINDIDKSIAPKNNEISTHQSNKEQRRSIVLHDLTHLNQQDLERIEKELMTLDKTPINPNRITNAFKTINNTIPNDHKVVKLKRSLRTDSDSTSGTNTTSDSDINGINIFDTDSTGNNDYKLEIIKKTITKETEKAKLIENKRKNSEIGYEMFDPSLIDLDITNLDPKLLEKLKNQTDYMYDLINRIKNAGILRSALSDFDQIMEAVKERKKRIIEEKKRQAKTTTTTVLPTVEMTIDEEMVKKALLNDPYVQRILKLYKKKKEDFFKSEGSLPTTTETLDLIKIKKLKGGRRGKALGKRKH